MSFGTCTLRREGRLVTFDWSNHAARNKFIDHIEHRIITRARYWVIKPPTVRLLYNNRMKTDHGVTPEMLRLVKEEVGSMLHNGEVSILDLQSPIIVVRPASGSIDILHQHTFCQSKDEPVENLSGAVIRY